MHKEEDGAAADGDDNNTTLFGYLVITLPSDLY